MKPMLFALSILALALPCAAQARPVLMISIDGLRPGDVIEAEQRGLKVPNLRRLLDEGAHAEGVIGVLPTVTYPSHTTLLTGASPAAHGIVNNTTFDPLQINQGGWYWYASDIKVPTLGESVREATVGKWLKQPGEAVAADEPLVELETDKVTVEVPAPMAGVLGPIAAATGPIGGSPMP